MAYVDKGDLFAGAAISYVSKMDRATMALARYIHIPLIGCGNSKFIYIAYRPRKVSMYFERPSFDFENPNGARGERIVTLREPRP